MSKRKPTKKVSKTKTGSQKAKTKTSQSGTGKSLVFEEIASGKGLYILLGLVALIGFIVFKDYLLLNKVYVFKDIGSDTLNLFYPQFVQVADYLRDFGFPTTWSWRHGMGQNILPFNSGDPFNWIMYMIGGQKLAYGIAYAEFFKVITGGLFFYLFLRTLNLNLYSSITGGVLFAFSGFMIVGGGWYIFSSEAAFGAMLLFAFEQLYSKNNWKWLPAAVFFVGSYMPFNLFPYALIVLVYSLFRFLTDKGWQPREYLLFMGKALMWSMLGFGMSALFTFSGFAQMLNSPRVSGDSSFFASLSSNFGFESAIHYTTVIMRAFANDLQGTGSAFQGWRNYLEAPMFYCGLSALLLAPQVFVFLNKKERIHYGILAGLFIVPVIFPFLRYAYWLFAGDYYRGFSMVVILGLLFFSMHALHFISEKGKIGRITLGVTLAVLLFLLFVPFSSQAPINGDLRNSVAVFLVLEAGLIFAISSPQFKFIAQAGLLLLICFEAGYLSSIPVNNRDVLTASELESKTGYNDYTVDALEFIRSQDQGLFRVEKDYSSGTAVHSSMNDARIQGYYGTQSYHSFNNNYYINFLTAADIVDPSDENQTRWAIGLRTRPLLANWASTKYLLVRTGQVFLPGYTKINQIGDIEIYQNNYFLELGFTYDKYIPESEYRSLPFLKKDISVFRSVILDNDQISRFSALSKIDTLSYPENYSPDLMVNDINALRTNYLDITSFREARIHGNIQLEKPKMVFFSIAYDKGWKARVNGKKMPVERVNIGFMGLMLPEGNHDIVLYYEPPAYLISIILSMGCLFVYLFFLWKGRKD